MTKLKTIVFFTEREYNESFDMDSPLLRKTHHTHQVRKNYLEEILGVKFEE